MWERGGVEGGWSRVWAQGGWVLRSVQGGDDMEDDCDEEEN